jgi:DNA-binding transcriptional LysR family regulator
MFEGPEFRHLRYFVAVAEECNFGRAAQRLHVTQPALSIQIKQLEEGLKATLFLRTPAGASLTHAGKTLLPLARQLLAMRKRAVEHTNLAQSGAHLPFRFGYSPWVNSDLVREAIIGYKEMVPGGVIEPSSHNSGMLSSQVLAGTLDAALVDLPLREQELMAQLICAEKLLICLRCDDPLAEGMTIPKEAVAEQLKIMFERQLHPLLFDQIEHKLARAGITLNPSDFVQHPSDVQFLVKEKVGLGFVREGIPLDSELTSKPIMGVDLIVETAFIYHELQQRPVLPLLAYRMGKCCAERTAANRRKKPIGRVKEISPHQSRMFG